MQRLRLMKVEEKEEKREYVLQLILTSLLRLLKADKCKRILLPTPIFHGFEWSCMSTSAQWRI